MKPGAPAGAAWAAEMLEALHHHTTLPRRWDRARASQMHLQIAASKRWPYKKAAACG